MAVHRHGDVVESEDSNDEDWEEELETFNSSISTCLFCDDQFNNAEELFAHCKIIHSFNINEIKRKFRLDCFGYIRLINFIRLQKPSVTEINTATSNAQWNEDKFMQPVIPDDILLTFDIESCESEEEEESEIEKPVTLTTKHYNDLLKQIKTAEENYTDTQEKLNIALTNIDKLKCLAQSYFLTQDGLNNSDEQKSILNEDESYFTGYSHFGIHHEMLQDRVRTESYRDAILKNKKLFSNKIVLDVGCGTGILSLFSIKAGATKSYAVDRSDIIYQAMDIVKENKVENQITLIKDRMENIELEVEKVDVLISEWMGYFLFFECMLDTIVYARNKYLSPTGHILPNRCTLHLAGINDTKRHDDLVAFWDDVYGFKMTCMKKESIKEVSIECVDPKTVVTTVATICDVDLKTCTENALEFSSPFELTIQKTDNIVALVSYFDVSFDLENPVSFSTSPSSKPTHWKQSVFYLEEPLIKNEGDTIVGNITCKRNEKDPRTLLLFLQLGENSYRYVVQ